MHLRLGPGQSKMKMIEILKFDAWSGQRQSNAIHKHQPESNFSARQLFKFPAWAGTVENENEKNLEIRCMNHSEMEQRLPAPLTSINLDWTFPPGHWIRFSSYRCRPGRDLIKQWKRWRGINHSYMIWWSKGQTIGYSNTWFGGQKSAVSRELNDSHVLIL